MAAQKKAAARRKSSDQVKIQLAHPLRAEHAVRLGLKDQDYNVEDEVSLRRDLAATLVNAGYVVVPEDNEGDPLGDASEDTGKAGTVHAPAAPRSTQKQPTTDSPVQPGDS